MKTKSDCMIFTSRGLWLQTEDASGIQLSFCGVQPLEEVRQWCQERGLDLLIAAGLDRKERLESYSWESSLSPIAREELAARGH